MCSNLLVSNFEKFCFAAFDQVTCGSDLFRDCFDKWLGEINLGGQSHAVLAGTFDYQRVIQRGRFTWTEEYEKQDGQGN